MMIYIHQMNYFSLNSPPQSLARIIHDAYRQCDNSLADFSQHQHQQTAANRLATTPTPALNYGHAQQHLLTPSANAAIRRSSATTPTSHRLSVPANAPRSASVSAPRLCVPSSARAAVTPTTRTQDVRRVSVTISTTPTVQRPATPAVARNARTSGPTSTPTTARVHIATINFLPSPSVVRSARPAASSSSAAPRTPNTAANGRPNNLNLQRTQRMPSSSATTPRNGASSAAAAATSTAPTRNVGSIFARTMIKLKTMVYKWRSSAGATDSSSTDVASCAICLEDFQATVCVR